MKLFKRNKTWSFKKTNEGKQVWISLRTEIKKDAETKKGVFLATLKSHGWDAATAELKGRRLLRKGESASHAAMEDLYRDFMAHEAHPVSTRTRSHNLSCLRILLVKTGAKTIGEFDAKKLKWTPKNTSTQNSQIRAASSIFKKSALRHWKELGLTIENPFAGIPLRRPNTRAGYEPVDSSVREAIMRDVVSLPPREQMIVLLALAVGFRRGEIDAARTDWLRKQKEGEYTLTVKEGGGFVPKSKIPRTIKISETLGIRLLNLRKECAPDSKDPFLIPSPSTRSGILRLRRLYKAILPWLAERGIEETKGIHGLRREAGSLVATNHGMLAAQKFLGHASMLTTEQYYANLTDTKVIDIQGIIGF